MTRMRPTRRRKALRSGDPEINVGAFYRDMLTGRYPAIPAPTVRDIEEWARGVRRYR